MAETLRDGESLDAAERAYQAVHAMIAEGEAPTGAWLRESTLARQIGVSRTPVRQALNRLAAEGAVELIPNRGAQVVSLSAEDIAALYELRATFEPLAAKLAVARLTETHLEELADLHEQMVALAEGPERDPRRMSQLNNDFHAVFLREAGNRHLTMAMQTMVRPAMVARNFHLYDQRALRRSMRHHEEILDAARAGDGEWAEAVMRAHILAARHVGEDWPKA